MRKPLQLRPFDVVVALRLLQPAGTLSALGDELAASPSQVSFLRRHSSLRLLLFIVTAVRATDIGARRVRLLFTGPASRHTLYPSAAGGVAVTVVRPAGRRLIDALTKVATMNPEQSGFASLPGPDGGPSR